MEEPIEVKPDVHEVIGIIEGAKFHYCGDCNKVCMDKRAYKNHLRSNQHLKRTPFRCYECNITYSSRFRLQIHRASKKHSTTKPFQCNFCHKRFTTQIYLKRHRMIHTSWWGSLHQCKQCWRKFSLLCDYLTHIKRHKDKEVSCNVCKRSFISNNYLKRHNCFGKGYECECKKSYKTLKGLRLHQETHKIDRQYQCDVCGKSYALKRYLQAHSRYHRDVEDSAFCEICFKKFPHKTSLRNHMKIHGRMDCDVCALSFNSRSELLKHKKIHKKLHVCQLCGKSFAKCYELKRHKLTHEKKSTDLKKNITKIKCEFCEKSISASNLCKHIARKHSPRLSHQCPKCDKTFDKITDLQLHGKVHQVVSTMFDDSPGLLGYFNCTFGPAKYFLHYPACNMPDLGERTLCSEKIFVPPSFPSIMKGYCKAAIRTQPYDLLRWSAAYFRALANGENPPAKDRLEFPHGHQSPGLTPGYLKTLVSLLGKDPEAMVSSEEVVKKWQDLCLPPSALNTMLSMLQGDSFLCLNFLAIAAASISTSLTQTMILLCETLSDDPEGGKASISVDVFLNLYEFLAYLDGSNNETSHEIPGIGPKLPEKQVDSVVEFMRLWSGRQEGMIMPRNIRHWMCPPLDNNTYASE